MVRAVVLGTPRLLLTEWLPEDAEDLHEVHADAETMRHVRSGRRETLAETRTLVLQYVDEQERRGWTKWRLAGRDGRLVGRAGFGAYGEGRELGFTLRRELWGRGLATEIAAALVARHRADRGFDGGLVACTAPGNAASARVLALVGFSPVGLRTVDGRERLLLRLDEP